MTTHTPFPVDQIWFDRGARQRRDLGDLSGLAESISKIGLINAIVITREGQLIAGERRLAAVRDLGWSHITVQFREDLTDIEREQLELDENIRRLDLPWQDRALAMHRYHQLCQANGGESWTAEQTADRLGFERNQLFRNLRVAKALVAGDQRVIEAPKFSVALGILERSDARQSNVEEAAVDELLRPRLATATTSEGGEPPPLPPPIESHTPILNEDFAEWVHSYTGANFNFIHCDFPYGINADKHDQGAAPGFGGYRDTAENYYDLIDVLAEAMEDRIAPFAHLMFWFSMTTYYETKSLLEAMGWKINPFPLIWWRSDNSGILPDPRRMPRQVYETAFIGSRGDRFLVGARSNLFASPNVKQFHMSEKPLPVLNHFLSMFVDSTTRMLDPTCGSGNAVIAAHKLGANLVRGLEIDPEFHALAVQNWKEQVDDDE